MLARDLHGPPGPWDLLVNGELYPSKDETADHTKTRVNADGQNNKCLLGMRKNLSVVAAYTIMADHVVADLTCVDEFCCLLRPLTSTAS